jgi:hypothetical protein
MLAGDLRQKQQLQDSFLGMAFLICLKISVTYIEILTNFNYSSWG